MNNTETETQKAAAPKSFLARRWPELLCIAALAFLAANSLLVIRQKSVTTDEAFMIPAGYYHLAADDMRPVNEHPPLVKILSAAPLLLMRPAMPPHEGVEMDFYNDPQNIYWNFWRANSSRIDGISFWSRVPMILLTVLLGALVFIYARRLFTPRAAAFAVLLFAVEPTVLAHSRVVQTDVPAALGFLLFCFAFYDYLRSPNILRALWLGAAAGLAVMMKFSMVVLAPVLAVASLYLLIRAPRLELKRRAVFAQVLAIAFAGILTIDAAYLFNFRTPDAGEVAQALAQAFPQQPGLRDALARLYSLVTRIVPADFIEGVVWQIGHARDGHAAGLLGRYSSHGWWWYFPVSFALKTTLAFLLLSVISLAWAVWSFWRTRKNSHLLILVPFAFYTGLVMWSSINIGVRYYLPAYVFLFIACGAFLDWILRHEFVRESRRQSRFAFVVVALTFAWMGFETARAYPDYMTYVNQLVRGAPSWQYLSDSNVEWGDDVRPLAEYLRERGEREARVALLNFLMLEPYGVNVGWAYAGPDSLPTDVRYVAIGASYLNGSVNPGQINGRTLTEEERVNLFDRYRRMTPEKIFGGSIYLYRVKE